MSRLSLLAGSLDDAPPHLLTDVGMVAQRTQHGWRGTPAKSATPYIVWPAVSVVLTAVVDFVIQAAYQLRRTLQFEIRGPCSSRSSWLSLHQSV